MSSNEDIIIPVGLDVGWVWKEVRLNSVVTPDEQ
jgi:hypothetical protein